jgi:hypothetical protein
LLPLRMRWALAAARRNYRLGHFRRTTGRRVQRRNGTDRRLGDGSGPPAM